MLDQPWNGLLSSPFSLLAVSMNNPPPQFNIAQDQNNLTGHGIITPKNPNVPNMQSRIRPPKKTKNASNPQTLNQHYRKLPDCQINPSQPFARWRGMPRWHTQTLRERYRHSSDPGRHHHPRFWGTRYLATWRPLQSAQTIPRCCSR